MDIIRNIDNKILTNKDAIKKANEVFSKLFNHNGIIPKANLNREEQPFLEFLFKFFRVIINNNFLKGKEILLLANANGQVIKIGSASEVPTYLTINDLEYLDFSVEAIGANAIGLAAKYNRDFCVMNKEHLISELDKKITIAVPLTDKNGDLVAIVGYLLTEENLENAKTALQKMKFGFNFVFYEYQKGLTLEHNLTKREALFTISKAMYSSFDVNEVLKEAVKNIKFFYPNDYLQIYMTQDYNLPDLPIKRLTFIEKKEDINSRAFMEGKLIVNRRSGSDDRKEIAVPLKGKQGVYGVIHLASDEESFYSDEKINFLINIAEIISIAFENAKLYQQSNNLVSELKIINSLTKKLNESLDKSSILQFVINESLRLFDASFACFFQSDVEKNLLTAIATNKTEYIGTSIYNNYGYMGIVFNNKESIIISDTVADVSVEDDFIKNLNFSSLIAVPTIVNDNIIGILTVASKKTYHFSYENFRMLQLLSQHLGLALTNAFLHEKIQHLAISDYLTGLYNRSYLDKQIEKSFDEDNLGSILLFDIDNFKKVNDTYGHNVGDKVLIQIANILKSNIRDGDIPARWGGEELTLYLPSIDTDIAVRIAERIVSSVESYTEPKVTVSCGIATWRKSDEYQSTNSSLIKQADQALYAAKNSGKNRVTVFLD